MKKSVAALEKWFQKVQRPLPWRKTTDPYAIWISETMLQQTQVAVVIPYYERFLKSFPTLRALAEAPESEVLQHWSGLGYYSRARNLQKGARDLLENFGGEIPRTRDEMIQVPGIGPYTAGAILSIAFNLPIPLVDGNVMRVFARIFGWEKEIKKKESQLFFWEKARTWVEDADSPRILNQALMELGATVCTKSSPKCLMCPVQKNCAAFIAGTQDLLPKRAPRKKSVPLYFLTTVTEHRGKYLVRQNPKGEWWHGLWDFPRQSLKDLPALEKEIELLKKSKALFFQKELSHQTHTVTHHKLHVVPVLLSSRRPLKKGDWVDRETLSTLPLSSLAKKVLASLEN